MILDFIFHPHTIKTFALVGPSGTGKSFQAKFLCRKKHIDFIIDDGLLIRNARIVAGHSAKEEKTFMAAVKAALFDEKSKRDEVARKLQSEHFSRVLILGTSEKMVNKIAARLQLPMPSKIIRIGEISTQKDIENAKRMRYVEGKHVIPVPGAEVKREYPSIFFNAIHIFKKKPVSSVITVPEFHEKSIVKPIYSRQNKIIISKKALSLMVYNCINEFNPKFAGQKIEVEPTETGYNIAITLDIPFGTELSDAIEGLQTYIVENIEHFTRIPVENVSVIIDKTLER
ncbi:MAG: ATP-binding protein [Spirochaetaceae bacterium]|jgi:ABC-type oligopeptide transport system ATPase subunit|nr:ATP-binding protein [Spirochaetaceae bacterium]